MYWVIKFFASFENLWYSLEWSWYALAEDSSFGLHCVGKISYTAKYCALLGRAWVGHLYQLFQAAVWTVTVGTLAGAVPWTHRCTALRRCRALCCSNVTHLSLALEMLLGVLTGTYSMTCILSFWSLSNLVWNFLVQFAYTTKQ